MKTTSKLIVGTLIFLAGTSAAIAQAVPPVGLIQTCLAIAATGDDGQTDVQKADDLLRQARKAMAEHNRQLADSFISRAEEINPKYGLFHTGDTPKKCRADYNRSLGLNPDGTSTSAIAPVSTGRGQGSVYRSRQSTAIRADRSGLCQPERFAEWLFLGGRRRPGAPASSAPCERTIRIHRRRSHRAYRSAEGPLSTAAILRRGCAAAVAGRQLSVDQRALVQSARGGLGFAEHRARIRRGPRTERRAALGARKALAEGDADRAASQLEQARPPASLTDRWKIARRRSKPC